MPPALVTAATTSRQWLKAKIGRSMPTSSVALVRMPRVSRKSGQELAAKEVEDQVQGVMGGRAGLVDEVLGQDRVGRDQGLGVGVGVLQLHAGEGVTQLL